MSWDCELVAGKIERTTAEGGAARVPAGRSSCARCTRRRRASGRCTTRSSSAATRPQGPPTTIPCAPPPSRPAPVCPAAPNGTRISKLRGDEDLWECFGSVQVRSCIGEVSCAAKYTREHCPSTPQLRALLSKSHPARSQSRLPPNLPIRKRANEQRLTALLCVCAQGRQGASRRTWTGTSFGRRKGPPPLSMARMSTRGTHCRRATNAVLSRNFPESFLDFVAISCVVSRDN